jgi:hypothetical protein
LIILKCSFFFSCMSRLVLISVFFCLLLRFSGFALP